MKTKIIEILQKNDLKIHRESSTRWYIKLADEILALFEDKLPENWRTFDCGVPRSVCEQEYVQGRGVGVKACYCEKCVGKNDMSFEEECPKCGDSDCQQHGYVERASEPLNKTMREYGCTCRSCHPEKWDKDERGVWFKKPNNENWASVGDEVI